MNVRDSEVVKGLLLAEGYKLADDPKAADVVLFNTCSVRQHAEDRVWSAIGMAAKTYPRSFCRKDAKTKRGGDHPNKKIIGVIGCMAQNYKKEVFRRAPEVDIVCGPSEIDNIALYIEEAIRPRGKVLAVAERKRKEEIYHTGFYEGKDHAYVVISEGCDNYCSYCVVPYVRGRLRHRPADEILREIKAAVESGIVNITLLGQNVNSYIDEGRKINFVELLKMINRISGLKSLSFLTCHPKDTARELFELIRDVPVISKGLHMPLQSGSDRILKAMNRGYTSKKYLKLVDEYRLLVYNGQLSTDIIVGFPGETDKDFQETLDLVKRVRFDAAYIFKYSPRPHTKAASMEDDVAQNVKEKRHAELLKLQKEISKNNKK